MRRVRVLVAATLVLTGALAGTDPTTLAAPSRDELDAAEARLLELEREFQLVSERYNLVNERLVGLQAEIGLTEHEIDRLERRLDARMDAAIGLARELYMRGSSDALEAVLSAQSLAEIETRVTYLRASEDAHARVFEELTVRRDRLDREVAVLETQKLQAARVRAELIELRGEIEDRVASQADEVARLNAELEAARARQAARAEARREAAAAPPSVGVTAEQVGAAPAPNPRAQEAVDAALSQVGKPYKWAAAGPDSYDCSGLTMWAWARAGVSLPHNSTMQYNATPRVPRDDWEPGDLLFFGSPIHHVAMYIGNGKMVEAPYSGQQVRINSAYRSDYVGAGRPGA